MTTVTDRLYPFLEHCDKLNIKFADKTYQTEELWQKLWLDYYDEDTKPTQVRKRLTMAKIRFPKHNVWERLTFLVDREYEKLVLYLFEKNILPSDTLDGTMEIQSLCLELFNKYIHVGDTTYIRQISDSYYHPHYQNSKSFKQLDMFIIRNDLYNMRILKVIEYCEKNSITIHYGEDGDIQVFDLWNKLFQTRLYMGRLKTQKQALKKAAPHLVYNSNDYYIKFVEHCKQNLISIQLGKDGYSKIQQLWKHLYNKELSLNQAKQKYKYLKQTAPSLFKHQASIKTFVAFKDLYTIPKEERSELLRCFGEFCTLHGYYFTEKDYDTTKIEDAWDYCFEIK